MASVSSLACTKFALCQLISNNIFVFSINAMSGLSFDMYLFYFQKFCILYLGYKFFPYVSALILSFKNLNQDLLNLVVIRGFFYYFSLKFCTNNPDLSCMAMLCIYFITAQVPKRNGHKYNMDSKKVITQ
jgi:hypothetical protein